MYSERLPKKEISTLTDIRNSSAVAFKFPLIISLNATYRTILVTLGHHIYYEINQ